MILLFQMQHYTQPPSHRSNLLSLRKEAKNFSHLHSYVQGIIVTLPSLEQNAFPKALPKI